MNEDILAYLRSKYDPVSILVFGSYVRGDHDAYSDFDCVIICREPEASYDYTTINGIKLDCRIFSVDEVLTCDPVEFIKYYAAEVIFDNGIGKKLKNRLAEFIEEHSKTSDQDKDFVVDLINKNLDRMKRDNDDAEYRKIVFLEQSLLYYCLLRDIFYYGTKDITLYLKFNDNIAYGLYHDALVKKDLKSIENWAEYIKKR